MVGDNSHNSASFETDRDNLEIIGELESDVLEVLKSKGRATASDITKTLRNSREIAYTTVSTTLDRLHKKRLVERKALSGPGGIRYLFSVGRDEKIRRKLIDSALDRLTDAFGETAYSAIYKKLDLLPEDELDRLKKQVEIAKRRQK